MRSSFTRPQGLDPSASPLRVVGVAADVPPDTPLGFSHRGPAPDPRWTVRHRLLTAPAAPRSCEGCSMTGADLLSLTSGRSPLSW